MRTRARYRCGIVISDEEQPLRGIHRNAKWSRAGSHHACLADAVVRLQDEAHDFIAVDIADEERAPIVHDRDAFRRLTGDDRLHEDRYAVRLDAKNAHAGLTGL